MNYKWPLINDNVSQEDKRRLIEFLSASDVRLTQGEKVKEFEDDVVKGLMSRKSEEE